MSALLRRPLVLAAACWAAFAGVLVAAYWIPFTHWADGWSVDGFLSLQRPWLNPWADRIAHLANPAPFLLASAAIVAIAIARGHHRHAVAAVALLLGANVAAQLLQALLRHPRVHDFLGHAQIRATAFPSGHATASMSVAFAAVLVTPARWRPHVAAAGALFALGVSESILVMGWHFPSDVLGGFLLAASFACLAVAGLSAAERRWPERSGREAARRALGRATPARVVGAVVASGTAAAAIALAIEGNRALDFADRHTTALAAFVGIAAAATALPAAVAGLSARRA